MTQVEKDPVLLKAQILQLLRDIQCKVSVSDADYAEKIDRLIKSYEELNLPLDILEGEFEMLQKNFKLKGLL